MPYVMCGPRYGCLWIRTVLTLVLLLLAVIILTKNYYHISIEYGLLETITVSSHIVSDIQRKILF